MQGRPGGLAQQAGAGALFTAQNSAVALAPVLQQKAVEVTGNPALDLAVGGVVVLGIVAVLNAFGQCVKFFDWFDQNQWLIPCMAVLSLGLAVLLSQGTLQQIVLNASMALDTALKNYASLNTMGFMSAGPPTHKDAVMALEPKG